MADPEAREKERRAKESAIEEGRRMPYEQAPGDGQVTTLEAPASTQLTSSRFHRLSRWLPQGQVALRDARVGTPPTPPHLGPEDRR